MVRSHPAPRTLSVLQDLSMRDGVGQVFVVVSGPPGSGKTTLARGLAAELRLPLFSKDTIKEALMATLGAKDPTT